MRARPSCGGRTRLLLRLGGRFLLLLAAGAALFPVVAPIYNRGVAAVVGAGFCLVEATSVTRVRAEAATLWIDRVSDVAPGGEPFTYFDPYLYFALVPLAALILATPGIPPRRRLIRLAMGLSLLFFLTAAYVVGSVEVTYVMVGLRHVGAAAWRALDWAQVLLRLLWEIGPLLIWAGLMVRDRRLLLAAGGVPAGGRASRGASQLGKGLAVG